MRNLMFLYSISAGAGLMIFPVILMLKMFQLERTTMKYET